MASRNYWLDLFTLESWEQFLAAGGTVSGFREKQWKRVNNIAKGDFLLCYVVGVKRFIGILEVVGTAYRDTNPIWTDETFPCRLKVKLVTSLTPETAIPIKDLTGKLSFLPTGVSSRRWSVYVLASPTKWKSTDGEVVVQAVLNAQTSPVIRDIDPGDRKYRPRALKTKLGTVTVPDSEVDDRTDKGAQKQPTEHTEIQWLLLKLGADMGFDTWVASNDRGRTFNDNRFSDIPRLKSTLPITSDEAIIRTIQLIDVLWLKGHNIVAAFEVESTTSIYSGLLRMSDLVAMQPHLNIPLYLVASDERREKVITEVNRPTFSSLSPKLSEICRYISFGKLRDRIKQAEAFIKFLKPEFLSELSESCKIDD